MRFPNLFDIRRPVPGFGAACLLALAAIVVLLPSIAHSQSTAAQQELPFVQQLDWQRYLGKWYEVARLPNSFQRKCVADVTADYGLAEDGNFRVVNRCARVDLETDDAIGEARKVQGDAGKLKVRFAPQWLAWLPWVWGDYWVIALDPQYQTALVGTPDREYLWLLSRSPQRGAADIDAWLQKAQAVGFDTSRVIRTPQTAQNTSVPSHAVSGGATP